MLEQSCEERLNESQAQLALAATAAESREASLVEQIATARAAAEKASEGGEQLHKLLEEAWKAVAREKELRHKLTLEAAMATAASEKDALLEAQDGEGGGNGGEEESENAYLDILQELGWPIEEVISP